MLKAKGWVVSICWQHRTSSSSLGPLGKLCHLAKCFFPPELSAWRLKKQNRERESAFVTKELAGRVMCGVLSESTIPSRAGLFKWTSKGPGPLNLLRWERLTVQTRTMERAPCLQHITQHCPSWQLPTPLQNLLWWQSWPILMVFCSVCTLY